MLGHAGMEANNIIFKQLQKEHNSIFKKQDDIKGCNTLVFK